jgi:heptosyltransferase-2
MIVLMSEFENILVRLPNWIGDLVMATPVLFALKKRYPKAKLSAMVKNPLGDLLLKDPHIDELFRFDKASGFARRNVRRDIVEKLAQGKYDLGILLTNSFSSAWWFAQARIKRRIGFATDMRSLFLTDAVRSPEEIETQHQIKTYGEVLKPLAISVEQEPKLYLTQDEIEQAKKALVEFGVPLDKPLIGINPGAAYGSAKCWLPDRFREVTLRLLKKTDATILFFGDRAGSTLVKEICQGLPKRVVNFAGVTSLRELMAYIHLCQVLLTNDSGPMHMACALDTKVVALFGSTEDQLTGPFKNAIVIRKRVSCSPCFKRTCPIDFRCMTEISVDEVVSALLESLSKSYTSSLTL